jgi:sialic acid synthase SpsE
MVRRIREAEKNPKGIRAFLRSEYGLERVKKVEGNGVKQLADSEKDNYKKTNRSIHALAEIPWGTLITEGMISILRTEKKLRPGVGPEFLSSIIGARAQRRIPPGEGVEWEDVIAHT